MISSHFLPSIVRLIPRTPSIHLAIQNQKISRMELNPVQFRKLFSRNRVVVASRRYASISLPSPCYRCARLCVHPMATSDSPKNSDLLTRCLTVDHDLRSVRLYFSDSASKNSQLSRSPRRSCRCPLIPRNRTRFHREDPREERGMSIFFSLFFSLRNSLTRSMDARS